MSAPDAAQPKPNGSGPRTTTDQWPDPTAPLLAWAEAWHNRSFRPIPLAPRKKNPLHDDWPAIPFQDNLALYFGNSHGACNLGVACGEPYGQTDIDLDCADAVTLWTEFFGPPTNLRWGRDSHPASHWLYCADPPLINTKYQTPPIIDPKGGKKASGPTILEVRGLAKNGTVGQQSMAPPSIHPDTGERIRFEPGYDREAANIDATILQQSAAKCAAAVLLAWNFPAAKGGRHDAFLALAGFLLRHSWAIPDVVQFHSAIYRLLWPADANFLAARTEVETTANKIRQGAPVTGFPALAALIDAKILRKAFDWMSLHAAGTAANTSATSLGGSAGPSASSDWRSRLLYSDQGKLLACYENADLYLQNSPEWNGVIGYNEFIGGVFIVKPPPTPIAAQTGSELEDQFDTQLVQWLERRQVMVKPDVVRRVVDVIARRNPYHPVGQYLQSLPEWDRVPRISTWLFDYCGVDSSEENPNHQYVVQVSAKFLISAIARIERPGCKVDHVLVLEGRQGLGKSMLARTLAGDEWFTDQLSDMGSKDCSMQLRGKWIIEFAELDALNRVERTRAKAFLTQQTDRFRPPYGHRVIEFPRQCVFIGTTNKLEWNTDETGSRRFWGVRCGDIDIQSLKRDRNQLWAEALARFRSGESWWINDPETAEEAVEQQEQRYVTNVWQDRIAQWLDNPTARCDEHGNQVAELSSTEDSATIDDILIHCIGKPVDRWTHSDKMAVSACLTALKWELYFAGPKSHRRRRYRPAKAD